MPMLANRIQAQKGNRIGNRSGARPYAQMQQHKIRDCTHLGNGSEMVLLTKGFPALNSGRKVQA